MCVLTYLPQADGGFVVTHNRDEATVRRPALPPKRYRINQHKILYPLDPQSNGTWIASSAQYTLCLLNGAFENHQQAPLYRQSRGLIIPDFFKHGSLENFVSQYQFEGIEPFTLVIIKGNKPEFIDEIRWDGLVLHQQQHTAGMPKIWSSATLYNAQVRGNRENWFSEWAAQHPDFKANSILEFHQNGGNGDHQNDMVMNRQDQIKTQCIMQIEQHTDVVNVSYKDLQTGQLHCYKMI